MCVVWPEHFFKLHQYFKSQLSYKKKKKLRISSFHENPEEYALTFPRGSDHLKAWRGVTAAPVGGCTLNEAFLSAVPSISAKKQLLFIKMPTLLFCRKKFHKPHLLLNVNLQRHKCTVVFLTPGCLHLLALCVALLAGILCSLYERV